jgi:hypothetical protein
MPIYATGVLSFAETKVRGKPTDILKVRIVTSDCVHRVSHEFQIQALCSVANFESIDSSTFLNKWNVTDKVSSILALPQHSCSRSAELRHI